MNQNRRSFLALAGLAPIVLIAAKSPMPVKAAAVATPVKPAAAACYDPATLPLSEKNRRRTVGFMEASNDPKKRCGLCAFFTAGQNTCGTCQLLSGGRVTSAGLCTSFAAKAV